MDADLATLAPRRRTTLPRQANAQPTPPMQFAHEMPFGASLRRDGRGTDFRLWAPSARQVELVWFSAPGPAGQAPEALLLEAEPVGDGWWQQHLQEAGHGSRYRWRIDGALEVPDPASRSNPDGPHGASEVVDPRRFAWSAAEARWAGVPWQDAVLYELHLGSFTPEGTLAAATSRLPELAALGITVVELMPLASFSGQHGWGYDGVLPFAPHAAYGPPDALKHFVQAAHQLGIGVMLDVVYNHFGPDGNYLAAYAAPFQSLRHRTPWGAAINLDGEKAQWVREFFIHNALCWLQEFRLDGLRLDAVHALRDDSPRHFLDELSQRVRRAVAEQAPGRAVHLVLENDWQQPQWLGAPGTPGRFEGNWNGDFHHCLHVLATGEQQGYYAEYDRPLAQLARVLTRGFCFTGDPATPSTQVASDTTDEGDGAPSRRLLDEAEAMPLQRSVNFLQCHDQVGNRAHGERLAHIAPPDAMPLLSAIHLLSPGVPLLFMGEEFASGKPFHYFVDAPDPALREAIRAGRQREFGHQAGDTQPLPDPCDAASFVASRLETPAERGPAQRAWARWTQHLLQLRRTQLQPLLPQLHASGHHSRTQGERGLWLRWYFQQGQVLDAVWNLGPAPMVWPAAAQWPALAESRDWLRVGELGPTDTGLGLAAWSGCWRWGRVPHAAPEAGRPRKAGP